MRTPSTGIRWLRLLLGTALAGLALGVAALFIILQPREPRLYAVGEEMNAGGFDAHLHFAVEEVRFLNEWGPELADPTGPVDPPGHGGRFCLVTVTVRNSAAGDLTVDSETEQTSAGLDQCTPDEYEKFQILNGQYKDKFGFPFVMAVRNNSRTQILSAFEQRLQNDCDEEFETALLEIHKIARLRLEKMGK